jgi:DNA topoisomerase-1
MARQVLIVESPSKAKTIARYLGAGVQVLASGGHIKDLPEHELGVDVERDFEPRYVLIPDERKPRNRARVMELRRAAQASETVYLAADPDREGEMICQHLLEELVGIPPDARPGRGTRPQVYRLTFQEITRPAIEAALRAPGAINPHLVAAQKARRVLDRLLGYSLSPWLSQELGSRGLSAGRVQSVALRFIVDRHRAIERFTPTEYWTIAGDFLTTRQERLVAQLHSFNGWTIKTANWEKMQPRELHITSRENAEKLIARLNEVSDWHVSQVVSREKQQSPAPPLTTSTLQQLAGKRLGFSVQQTMEIAQRLYEGCDLPEGRVGLITYPRTDSTRLAPEAIASIRKLIRERYGEDYLPASPPVYPNPKGAQEAHEAIRPTEITRLPETLTGILSEDEQALYTLVWQRAVASQMAPARLLQTVIDILGETWFVFRASGTVVLFPGFRILETTAPSPRDDATGVPGSGNQDGKPPDRATEGDEADETFGTEPGDGKAGEERQLPHVFQGEPLVCRNILPQRHQTTPPRPYTEATLVRAMEMSGIGRPSTYAQVIQTLLTRQYIVRHKANLEPTRLGIQVCDVLVNHFPDMICPDYTAHMERELDEVAEGKRTWQQVVRDFYARLQHQLIRAHGKRSADEARNTARSPENTVSHPSASSPDRKPGPAIRGNRDPRPPANRPPASPSGASRETDSPPPAAPPPRCPLCNGPMQKRKSAWGPFWGCKGYPRCKGIRRLT